MGSGRSTEHAQPCCESEGSRAASKLLLNAARRCDADAVQKALVMGADPNTRSDHSGRPALSFAAQCADTSQPLQHLLCARAHVDATAHDGRTALHIAVAWERGAAASKLVEVLQNCRDCPALKSPHSECVPVMYMEFHHA
ncbi:unnamed protein product [Symbiodinium pilosum]|uniref:Uncharacterized protein n=1 Tax=Symbiodinium pilosum TaxID=2952 RepID=A0A812MZA4_SYMPI|nr:unnamed protein product [Symbiodinium pilosum]